MKLFRCTESKITEGINTVNNTKVVVAVVFSTILLLLCVNSLNAPEIRKETFMYLPPFYTVKKSRIRETPTLSTDADSRTDTNLKRSRDLSKYIYIFFYISRKL